MRLHIIIHSVICLGLVFWDWEVQVNRKGTEDRKDFHTEVSGRSNRYKGACESVEHVLTKYKGA